MIIVYLGKVMSRFYVSIKAKNLKALITYYEVQFNARVLDSTDTSVLMILGNTIFELVQAAEFKIPSTLTIDWDSKEALENFSKDLELDISDQNGVLRSRMRDMEGNLIEFTYSELTIPSEVMIEEI